ncbi:hypothetical protein RQN9TF_33215 (plasmid) [Rhodococcus qingshengii]|uniref:hypothetical protein n=1 Tax=Rhodococcus TaxID=1827 RepID=UPI001F1502CB|nr:MULTISPECIES: hypothetical protein [Rhodococcus]BDQ24124.1 hypothetical protein RQN9TF_33215 [Rhodococcus qingshengii]
MRPIASFSAMFVWAILLIAVVGIAVSLTQGAWAPTVAWAIARKRGRGWSDTSATPADR